MSAETALFLHQQEFYHWQWLADRQFNNPSISASSSSTLPPIDSALLEDAEKEEINRDILRKVLLHGRAAAIAALEKASSNENANSGGGGGQQQLQS